MKNLKSIKKHIFLPAFLILLLSITGISIAAIPDEPNNMSDTDHNEITDSWEIGYFGNIGIDPSGDPDGDGLTNLEEYLIDTNPNSLARSNPAVFDSNNDSDDDGFTNLQEKQCPMNTDPTRGDSYPGDGNLLINAKGFWPDEASISSNPANSGIWLPAGWVKQGVTSPTCVINWESEDDAIVSKIPRYLKMENTSDTVYPSEDTGWYQDIPIEPPSGETWYELIVTYKMKDRTPCFNLDGEGGSKGSISRSPAGQVTALGKNAAFSELMPSMGGSVQMINANFLESSWDDSDGCYHEVDLYSDPDWQTQKVYTTVHPDAASIRVSAKIATYGKIYFKYISLKKVSGDLSAPAFKKSGRVKFLKNAAGEDVFMIGILYPPTTESGTMSSADVKNAGFNAVAVSATWHNQSTFAAQAAAGLYGIGTVGIPPYARDPGYGFKVGTMSYLGLEKNKNSIGTIVSTDRTKYPEILVFDCQDESNLSSSMAQGGFAPDLRELNYFKEKVGEQVEGILGGRRIPLMFNMGIIRSRDYDIEIDKHYAGLSDVMSFTWNGNLSYTYNTKAAMMPMVGRYTRRWLEATASVNGGESKPVMAFGLGVYKWSGWDWVRGYWDKDRVIPFHLQRFQVYNQVVNGAGGLYFYTNHINFNTDPASKISWEQIAEIGGEFSSLYNMYVTPDFYDEWTCSDNRIEAMLKKYNGKIYLIATNPRENYAGDVTFTISSVQRIVGVKALFENADTAEEFPLPYPSIGVAGWEGDAPNYTNYRANKEAVRKRGITDIGYEGRDIAVNSDNVSFTDKFIDYAVHVYEIEYVPHVGDEVISIELNDAAWILDGIEPGEVRDNIAYFDADRPRHAVKNTGNVNVAIDIGYGPSAGQVQPGIKQDIDRFITCVGRPANSVIIPPTGKAEVGVGVRPGDTLPLWLTYGAPTALSQQISGMSAAYEIRAYKSTDEKNISP